MKIALVEKAGEILKEIKELKYANKLLASVSHKDVVHFRIHQHFGDCDNLRVIIDKRHTSRLMVEVEKIIKELEQELDGI